MNCPSCGGNLPDVGVALRFCNLCGAMLKPAGQEAAAAFCVGCGTEVPAGTTLCPACDVGLVTVDIGGQGSAPTSMPYGRPHTGAPPFGAGNAPALVARGSRKARKRGALWFLPGWLMFTASIPISVGLGMPGTQNYLASMVCQSGEGSVVVAEVLEPHAGEKTINSQMYCLPPSGCPRAVALDDFFMPFVLYLVASSVLFVVVVRLFRRRPTAPPQNSVSRPQGGRL